MARGGFRKWITRIAFVLALMAALPFLLSLLVDANFYKPLLEKQLSKTLGVEVKVDRLRLSLFPKVEADALGVELGDFFKAEQLSAAADFLPLFAGKVRVGTVTISNFAARLDKLPPSLSRGKLPEEKRADASPKESPRQDNDGSPPEQAAAAAPAGISVNIRRIRLREGMVERCDGKDCQNLHILSLNVKLPGHDESQGYRASGDILALGVLPLSLEAELDKQLRAEVDAGQAILRVSGEFAAKAPYQLDANAILYGKDLEKFAALLAEAKVIAPTSATPAEPFSLAVTAKGELQKRLKLSDIKLQLGSHSMAGSGDMDLVASSYRVNLQGKKLKFPPLPALDSLSFVATVDKKGLRAEANANLAGSSLKVSGRGLNAPLQWRMKSPDLPLLLKRLEADTKAVRLPKQLRAKGNFNPEKKSVTVTDAKVGDSSLKGSVSMGAGRLTVKAVLDRLDLDQWLAEKQLAPPPAEPRQLLPSIPKDSPFARVRLELRAKELKFRRQSLKNLSLMADYNGESKLLTLESLTLKGGLASSLKAGGEIGKSRKVSIDADGVDLNALYRILGKSGSPPFAALPKIRARAEFEPSSDLKAEGTIAPPKTLGDKIDFAISRRDNDYDISLTAGKLAIPPTAAKMKTGAVAKREQQIRQEARQKAQKQEPPLARLLKNEGKFKVKVGSLVWGKHSFLDLQALGQLRSGKLEVKRLTAGFAEGEISAVAGVSLAKAEGELTMKALKATALSSLLVTGGKGMAGGIINGDLEFSAVPFNFVESLAAAGSLMVDKPLMVGGDLEKINDLLAGKTGALGLATLVQSALVGGQTEFDRLLIPIAAKKGKVKFRPTLEGSAADGRGELSVGLAEEDLKGIFTLKFAAAEAPPLRLLFGGSISEPTVTVEDQKLLEFALRQSLQGISPDNLAETIQESGEAVGGLVEGLQELLP